MNVIEFGHVDDFLEEMAKLQLPPGAIARVSGVRQQNPQLPYAVLGIRCGVVHGPDLFLLNMPNVTETWGPDFQGEPARRQLLGELRSKLMYGLLKLRLEIRGGAYQTRA